MIDFEKMSCVVVFLKLIVTLRPSRQLDSCATIIEKTSDKLNQNKFNFGFCWEGKTTLPWKNLLEHSGEPRNSSHLWSPELNPCLIAGRQLLLPLCQMLLIKIILFLKTCLAFNSLSLVPLFNILLLFNYCNASLFAFSERKRLPTGAIEEDDDPKDIGEGNYCWSFLCSVRAIKTTAHTGPLISRSLNNNESQEGWWKRRWSVLCNVKMS